MATLAPPLWAGLFLLSLSAAGVVLMINKIVSRKPRPVVLDSDQTLESHFLFEDGRLVDHDVSDLPDGSANLASIRSWADLLTWLQPRFSKLPSSFSELSSADTTVYHSTDIESGSTLHIIRDGTFTRVLLKDDHKKSAAAWHSALSSMQSECSAASVLHSSPDPIWRTNSAGAVVWRNAACAKILDEHGALPKVKLENAIAGTSSENRVAILDEDTGCTRWYELRSLSDGQDYVHFATDITQVIHAESVQREFVQTLTKTFANLTTGLAIFDKSNRLALFNPALVDLTDVPVAFLSERPDLMRFFDQLREQQVLPEPKNYANWRAQVRDAVTQANNGLYKEMWTLPNGRTYRVTGRPHPDGAVAFLFEDISDDISVTRQFRRQIELRQSVIDGIEEAVAVISSNNLLLFCNKACNELLNIDPDTCFADLTTQNLLKICEDRFGNSDALRDFKDRLLSEPSNQVLTSTIKDKKGQTFICRSKPLPGGSRMLTFGQIPVPAQQRPVNEMS